MNTPQIKTSQIMSPLSADIVLQTEVIGSPIGQMPTSDAGTTLMPYSPMPTSSPGMSPPTFSYQPSLPHTFTDTSPPAGLGLSDISSHNSSLLYAPPPCSCMPIQQEIYDLTTHTHARIVQAYSDLMACLTQGFAMPWQGYTAQFYRRELDVIIAHLRAYTNAL